MGKVNQACSDASYLRIMAGTMVGLFFLSFFPFVGTIGTLGLWFLLLAIPTMTIRWFVKFGAIQSDDPDLQRGKRAIWVAVGIWALFLVILLAGVMLRK